MEKEKDKKNSLELNKEKKNSKENRRFVKMKSSYFGSANPRRVSGFFGPIKTTKKAWIDDRPAGEGLGEFYEIRKKIIFGKINIINNEKEFIKFILDSQKKANDIIQKESLFFTPRDVYDWTIALKENIANFALVINYHLKCNKNIIANQIFLLMHRQNKEKVVQIYKQIQKNFQNMSNSNRIGKFYPSIIRLFLQILSVIIKFANKFNKYNIENFYLNKYLFTIHKVKKTVIDKFVCYNVGVEGDFKSLGRFLFYDCLYKLAIYSFIKYYSFDSIMMIFHNIIDSYNNFDELSIVNMESILLLKTNYNLGLILYTTGNSQDSISRFLESKTCLDNIYYFPYTITQFAPKQKIQKSNLSNYLDKSTLSSFNIDESIEKIMNNQSRKKRSVSTKVNYDNSIKEKEVYFGLKQKYCSVINFGKNKIIILEKEKNVENYIRQQIILEIELISAEIELDKKNFIKSFLHVNSILSEFHIPNDSIKTKLTFNRIFKDTDRASLDFFSKSKMNPDKNMEISDVNRRRIFHILQQIELEFNDKNYSECSDDNSYIDKSYKKFEEIKNLSSYESTPSKSAYIQTIYNNKFFEFDKEKKLILATEKFFIFICSLSLYQLKILNEFQPEQSQKRDELPILFPSQFKDCLTFNQRLALNHLDTMSLSRCVILIDPKKDISPENLNYLFLTTKKPRKKKSADVGVGVRAKPRCHSIMLKKNDGKKIFNDKYDMSMNSSDMENPRLSHKNFFKKNNIKKNMFIQGKFDNFLEEDSHFNNKINELSNNKDKNKLTKNKITKIMKKLNCEEKELLMEDEKYMERFIQHITNKINKPK